MRGKGGRVGGDGVLGGRRWGVGREVMGNGGVIGVDGMVIGSRGW